MAAIYSIILAGGSGSRLWPLSRTMYPKQMFKLEDENTLFQQTFLRLSSLIDDKNIITTTNVKHASIIKEQLKTIQEKFCRNTEYKMLTEPVSKNTAPAICLAVKYISEQKTFSKESPVILVVPSDHIIHDRETFTSILEKGIKLAKEGYIVSFSTKTDDINENFGYIKARRNEKVSLIEPDALKVSSSIEKPETKDIKTKLKGQMYINTGMYMFTAETFLNEIASYSKDIFKIINSAKITTSIPSIEMNIYDKITDISIDYALMEKSKKLVTIPFKTEWKDIGSWDAIYDINKKDENGNYISGNAIDIDSKNSIIYSTSKLVATMGLKDAVVVETEDAVLVCNKNEINGVKKIYKKLNGKNSEAKDIHKTVYRPWGYYTVLENGNGFLTKCIVVNPDAKLSLQKHNHRSEHWIILEGEATVIKGEETYKLPAGESIDIDVKEIHSLQNFGTEQLKVLEIQQGDILDENDIERIQDIYGRA